MLLSTLELLEQHLGSMHAKTRVCSRHRQIFGGNSKTESPPNSNPSSRASLNKIHGKEVFWEKQSTVNSVMKECELRVYFNLPSCVLKLIKLGVLKEILKDSH